MGEDDSFRSTCRPAGGNDNCVTILDGLSWMRTFVGQCRNTCRLHGFKHGGAGGSGESLVKRKDGVAFVPCSPDAVNHLRATGHIQADEVVHGFRLWEVRHLTNE